MFRKALTIAGALLVLFHAGLLASQVWTGEMADLALAVRWIVSGGLGWALWGLRRQGASMFWGRRAVALWLLAALLHGPALAQRFDAPGLPAVPEVVTTLTQVSLGTMAGIGIALWLGLLAAARRRPRSVAAMVRSDHAFIGARSPDSYVLFAPRPPPLA